MKNETITVREIQLDDIPLLCDYWYTAEPGFLENLGVDLDKMVDRKVLESRLEEQLRTPYKRKRAYAIIWLLDRKPIGHCNIGNIVFGRKAFMHLHMWKPKLRKKGLGAEFVKLSLPFFFEKFELDELFCQPYALNKAPNKTLEKVGFQLLREYVTVPGSINFEQPVKLWRMSRERFLSLKISE